jgi:hypothetical protein
MAFYAGKTGSVTVGAAVWKLSEWTLDFETDIVDVSNFASSGYRENVAGLTKATITGKGPFDSGSMALTSGTQYSITLGLNSGGVTFVIPARVGKISLATNVEGKPEVSFTAESTGTITAAIS